MSVQDHHPKLQRDWRRGGLWTLGVGATYLVFLGLARILVAARFHGPFISPYFLIVVVTTAITILAAWPLLARAAAHRDQRQVVEQVLVYGLGGALSLFLLLLFTRSIDGALFSHVANFVGRDLVRASQIQS